MCRENSIKKLKRKDLLEVLLLQNTKIKELEEELKKTKELLNKREIILSEAGSIAEASIKINEIFEVAQKAADDYLKSIRKIDKSNNKKEKQAYNKKIVIKKDGIYSKEWLHEKK